MSDHDSNHNPPKETTLGVLVTAGVALLAILLFALLLLTIRSEEPRPDQARVDARIEAVDTAREAQQKAAASYGWVDEENKIVRVPVDRAVELIVQEAQPMDGQEGRYEIPLPEVAN